MDKYRRAAEKKLGDKVHPDIIAQEALDKAEFSKLTSSPLINF